MPKLGYSQRNLGYIDQLIELGASLTCLSKRLYKRRLVIEEALNRAWLNQGMNDNLAPIQKLVWV